MNILLVYPRPLVARLHQENVESPPMGLYYIAALLREHGHDARILNLADETEPGEDPLARLEVLLDSFRPGLVGVSVLQANRFEATDVARLAKRRLASATVVFGGVAATCLWDHFLRHVPELDFVVLGEGERTTLELAQAIERGADPAGIPGLALRQAGVLVRTDQREPVRDLDSLPNPAGQFTYRHLAMTRGCPGRCRFCGSPAFWGPKVRAHSPGYLVDQLEMLSRKGVDHFLVSDDTFTLEPERVVEVCRQILDRGLTISWQAISRVDRVDGEVLGWMRRAGCTQVSFGVESGSEAIRRTLGKRFSDEQIVRAVDLTQQYGMIARAYFIYGCPGESDETIKASVRLIEDARPLLALFYVLSLYPGTELYERLKERMGISDDIWLEPIEDLPYYQLDPSMDEDRLFGWSVALRRAWGETLPKAVRGLELVDDPALHAAHADFLARLGLTLSHGELAQVELIPDKAGLAGELFTRSLTFGETPRAYLGQGLLAQSERRFDEATDRFAQGLKLFPGDKGLCVGLGVSLMNLGRFHEALEVLSPFEADPGVARYTKICRQRR